MYPSFRDYFYFNRSERRGIITLIVIIFLIIIIKELFYVNAPSSNYQNDKWDSLITKIEYDINIKDSLDLFKSKVPISSNNFDTFNFYDFDPNDFPARKWQDFGLTKKQAEVIKKYESSGGNFRSKKDVKKMFVISDKLFQSMKDHILLPDSIVYENKKEKKYSYSNDSYVKSKEFKVNINTADSIEFKKLYGIGNVLSKRIVEYREKLGGFHAKEQLKEVYGLKEEVIINLDSQLFLGVFKLKKMNINAFSANQLKMHPYVNWKVANSIVKYREQHGDFKDIQDIKKSVLVSDSLFEKLKPYLEN